MDYAVLGKDHEFIIFEYQNYRIRFKAPYSLERFTSIKKWDEGYLVVMAKYAHRSESEEEYIDLVPILENLYISPKEFLKPIKEVECMHVHASDRKLTETGSAKLFVKNNGDTVVQNKGLLNDREMAKIQQFIKENYKEMYIHWLQYSNNGFYEK